MLTCEICGEEVLLEEDMRSHLVISHLEREVRCPLCPLAGISYDELQFHINAAHPETDWVPGKQKRNAQTHSAFCGRPQVALGDLEGDPSGRGQRDVRPAQEHMTKSVRHLSEGAVPKTHLSASGPNQDGIIRNGEPQEAAGIGNEMWPSPGKVQQYPCPMCSLVCSDCFILQEHMELHLQEQDLVREGSGYDLQLARQLQEEEHVRLKIQETKREAEDFKKLQRQFGLDDSGGYRQQAERSLHRAVSRGDLAPAEFHRKQAEMMETLASGIDDGRSSTSGVMTALCEYYLRNSHDITNVWLSAETNHYASSEGDRGWGCGYRNFQMLLSSLQNMELYSGCFPDGTVPSIPRVQTLIEEAWQEGIDPQGASQFRHRLRGTRAWIGATEIFSLFTSLGLRARIVDFPQPSGPGNTHPHLFDWVKKYFTSTSRSGRLPARVVKTKLPPLYLQHQGHSRTIVGMEQKKSGGLCLLMFDPGCPSENMRGLLTSDITTAGIRRLRRFPSNLKHRQYQILAVEGVLSPEDKQVQIVNSRTLRAERIH